MSDAPELNETDPIQSLCVAAGAAVGGSVAGPFGIVIGGIAGRLLHRIITNPDEFGYGIITNLTSDLISGGFGAAQQRIRARFTAKPRPEMIDALQAALGQALKAAVMDIGGPGCFKAELKNAPQIPAGIIYRDTPSGSQLWRNDPALAAQTDDLLRHLAQHIGEPATLKQAVDARDVLDVTTPELLASELFEQVAAPWLTKHRDVLNEADGFAKHLQTHLFSRTLAHLGEALKTDTPVWRTFNRWIMEEMRAELQELGAGQDEIISRLDTILGFEDKLANVSQQLAEQFVMLSRTEIMIAAGLTELSDRLDIWGNQILGDFARLEEKIGLHNGIRTANGNTDKSLLFRSPLHVNIPLGSRELIGREKLLDKIISRLLRRDSIVLCGRGGIGKTAIAVAITKHPKIIAHFGDGVLWGSLGISPNITEVLVQWGQELGWDLSSLATDADRSRIVKNKIALGKFLIVIDDCWDYEHAKSLICGGPNSVHLFTTRSSSSVSDYIGRKSIQSVEKLTSAQSIKLLREMAPKAWKKDSNAIRKLASATEHLPLSLELVGRFLSSPEYHTFPDLVQSAIDKLTDPNFRLELKKERLGESGSERSLAEVIELSLVGLAEEAKQTFYALGAFAPQPARFDLDAAMEVSGADRRIFAILSERGLLEVEIDGWLTLHQTISAVAKRKLASIESDALIRHCNYYIGLPNKSGDDWQVVEAAYGQIQQAWNAIPDSIEMLFPALQALATYHQRRSLWHEWETFLTRSLRVANVQREPAVVGAINVSLGEVCMAQGHWNEANQYYEKALTIKKMLRDRLGEAHVLVDSGVLAIKVEHWDEGMQHLEAALVILREMNDRRGEGRALANLGIIYEHKGQWDKALRCYEQDLVICRDLHDKYSEGQTLNNLGNLSAKTGDLDKAVVYYEQDIAICHELGDVQGEALTHINLGCVFSKQSLWDGAIESINTGLAMLRALGGRPEEGPALTDLGVVYRNRRQWGKAIKHYVDAVMTFRKYEMRHGEGVALINLANVYQDLELNIPSTICYLYALTKLRPDSPEYRSLRRALGLDDDAQVAAS